MINILSIDVEDWHHRLAYSKILGKKKFPGTAVLGVQNYIKILEKYNHKATFFIVGEILEDHPELASIIVNNGHEIANHTYSHKLITDYVNKVEFFEDLSRTSDLIYNITGLRPKGFRAPKWSLTKEMNWVVKYLIEQGYEYDSSLYPATGFNYGAKNAKMHPYKMHPENILGENPSSNFYEFPTMVYPFLNFKIPIKLRYFGSKYFNDSISKLNHYNVPATLVFHTWEITDLKNEFEKYGSTPINLLRNFRIPFNNLFEKVMKTFKFTSISNYMKILEMKNGN